MIIVKFNIFERSGEMSKKYLEEKEYIVKIDNIIIAINKDKAILDFRKWVAGADAFCFEIKER